MRTQRLLAAAASVALLGADTCRAQGTGPKDGWTLLYRQTVPFYKPAAEWALPFGSDTDPNYSALNTTESFRGKNGKFHLKQVWPQDTGTGGESRSEFNAGNSNEWQQVTNFVTGAEETAAGGVEGYEAVEINYSAFANMHAEGNDDDQFYGLEKSSHSLADGSVDHGYWFYAVGSPGPWGGPPGGIPGGHSDFPERQVELWAKWPVVNLPACIGDVCHPGRISEESYDWGKSPFPHCPAGQAMCGLPASEVKREVRCEKLSNSRQGEGARSAGLDQWMPAELAQTDASYGGYVSYKPDNMEFVAPMMPGITLDGSLSDWLCAPIKAQTPFYPYNAGEENEAGTHCCGDKLTMFDDRDNTAWNALDQSSAVSFAWEAGNFYIGVKVIDDSHENAAGSGWNGDSVQIAFTNPERTEISHLYNYAFVPATGDTVTHHEAGHPEFAPDTEAAIFRDEAAQATIYEIKIPATALTALTGMSVLKAGHAFGVAVCVNDGDSGVNGEDVGEGGQKGWSGWGPYAIVYGKTPSQAGLVTLGEGGAPLCPADAACALAGERPETTKTCPATPACYGAADRYHWVLGKPVCPSLCGMQASQPARPVSCQLGGKSGLEAWMPKELEQTDAAYASSDVIYVEDSMTFDAPAAAITLDGDFSDWQCAEIKAQTPFYPYNKATPTMPADGAGTHCCGDKLTMFDDFNGAVAWDSLDQSSAVSFAWDQTNFYIGVKVIDDSHENAAGSGWNGDSVQIAFTNPERTEISHLYNYAFVPHTGDTVTHHEAGHPETAPDTRASVTRHATLPITMYEIAIPVEALLKDLPDVLFQSGHSFGVGVAVNDGDSGVNGEDIGEGGQKGWSGWGPYAIVYAKTPSQAGLVTLTDAAPATCSTDVDCESQEGLATKPAGLFSCPATAACGADGVTPTTGGVAGDGATTAAADGGGGSGMTVVMLLLGVGAGFGAAYYLFVIAKKPKVGAEMEMGGGIYGGEPSGAPP